MQEFLMLFTLISAIILLTVIFSSQKGSGRISLFNRAEVEINFDKGWQSTKPQQSKLQVRPSQQPYQHWLEVKNKRWRFPLSQTSAVYVGRKQGCQIQLNDPKAAPQQAYIYWEDGRFKIINLSATHVRTKVNGRPITKQNLGHGNTIEMGRTKLIFRDASKVSHPKHKQ